VTTILVLAEEGLTDHDVARVADLRRAETSGDSAAERVRAHVVVPVAERRNRFVEALDEVALGRLPRQEPGDARVRAQSALDASVAALRTAGVEATGSLADDDPVDDVAAAAGDEIWVFTSPHLIEDGLHRDWASRLRQATGRPVLHVVAGTDRVVS
jgi:hypothetical protein